MRMQTELFPIQIKSFYPLPPNTAHAAGKCIGSDNLDYVIKTTSAPNVPSSEWICSSLARDCQIPTPQFKILTSRRTGDCFGSAYEGGVVDISEKVNQNTLMRILTGELAVDGFESFLSKCYALDLFINNTDRHFKNFLFRESNGRLIALSMDFSIAWLSSNDQFLKKIQPIQTNTRMTSKILFNGKYAFIFSEAEDVFAMINKLSTNWIVEVINQMPGNWIDEKTKKQTIDWWQSSKRKKRCELIMKGLKDGSLL